MYKIKLSPYHNIFYNEWKLDPYSSKYNIVFDQTFSPTLDILRLKNALNSFVSDYLLLNSHIIEVNDQGYWVKNNSINDLEYFDSDHYSHQNLYEYVARPFDLKNQSLYRLGIFKNQNNEYRLIFVVHHIIMDGASVDKFIITFSKYYNNNLYNSEPNLNAQRNLISSITTTLENNLLLNSTKYKKFWNNLLYDVEPLDLRFLKLNSEAIVNKKCDLIKEFNFTLCKSDTDQLNSIARRYSITPYIYSQCIFALLLYRYTNQNKFALSYPTSIKEGSALICGCRINTTFIVYEFSQINSINDLFIYAKSFFKSVKNDKINYSYYPVYKILDNVNKGILSITFAQTNLKNTKFDFIETETLRVNNEFNIDLSSKIAFEQENRNNQLNYRIKYNSSETDSTTLEIFIKHYKKLFLSILADLKNGFTHKLLISYPILDKKEYNKVVYEWNQTKQEYPNNKTIHQLFEEQVIKTPHNIAVVYEGNKFTYQELNQRANQLARYINQTCSVKSDDLIAICLDRSEHIIVSILAILKCRAAYVPIDMSYPSNRINHMLKDATPKIILTSLRHEIELIGIVKNSFIITLDSEANLHKISQEKNSNLGLQSCSNSLVYVIYTSGTTGNPKGVMVEHKSVINTISHLSRIYEFNGLMKVTAFTSHVFDVSVSEFFTTLLRGSELHMLSEKIRLDAQKISDYLLKNRINYVYLPPVLLAELPKIKYSDLIGIIYAGEPCNRVIAHYWSSKYKLFNLYGPTETAIYSTGKQILNGDSNLIGKPINNTKAYVLDSQLIPLPIGAIGELYIGGSGLARGYLNQPHLTEEKFIINPFQTLNEKIKGINSKLYRTGDLVRYLPDGNIEYIGRNDTQIKIRGYRIEPSEIETILCKYPGIKQAVVLALDNKNNLSNTLNITDYTVNKIEYPLQSINFEINEPKNNLLNKQDILDNELEMLPIQEWFFTQNFKNIHHWNQSFLIKAPNLDKTVLLDSLIEIVNYHDNFKLRYRRNLHANKQEYTQYFVNEVYGRCDTGTSSMNSQKCETKQLHLRELNISQIPYIEGTQEFNQQMYRILTDWQSTFDIENGPLFTFGYIYGYRDGSVRIYFALHHLIIDVVSWHIILYDLQKIYAELYIKHKNSISNGSSTATYLLGKKYTSYSQWINIIKLYANNNMSEKDYWLGMLSGYEEFDKYLTLLIGDSDNKSDSLRNVIIKFVLDEDYTTKLINISKVVHNNKIDEMLTAVLAIALKELLVKNISSISYVPDIVYITIEGHGREDISISADTSHTIGWFTTMFPVKLVVNNNIMEMVKSTQQIFQSIPNKGVGYGALFGYTQIPRISFNYLGQIDNNQSDSHWFITGEPSGKNVDCSNHNPNIIDIVSLIVNNKLVFNISSQLNKKQLEQFVDVFKRTLIDLVNITATINLNNYYSAIDYKPETNITYQYPDQDNTTSLRQNMAVASEKLPATDPNNQTFNKCLVAYYVSDVRLDQIAIREYLSNELPVYAIPQIFIGLNALPITPGGKLNIKALPYPITDTNKDYTAPRNEKEHLICKAFTKVLDKEFISIYDDFFICGGDSILAITLVMHLQNYFSVSVRDVCTYRTPNKLAQHVGFSNNSIKNRLLEIMHLHEHSKIIEEHNKKVITPNLDYYMDSIKELHPDTSVKNITNVLLTGATGYLGCNILNQLINITNYTIYILVRANSDLAALERINHKYNRYFNISLKRSGIINSRVFVLNADIEQTNFGLTQALYAQLVNKIDSVIHAAALVKQFGEDDIFYRANVKTTINLLEFSKLTKTKDFHYISTVSVLKHNNEFFKLWNDYYTEEDLPDNLQLLDNNIYLRTKLEAEQQVVKYRQCGMNTNIYRVGNLAFMLKNLCIQENIATVGFGYWIKYLVQSGKIFSNCRIDISPADLTANAVVKLFDKKCSTNNIYHVFNPYSFNLVNYMQSEMGLSVKILSMPEFIKYIINDLENSTNPDLILRFLLAHGWMGVEGFYQFFQKTYLQNKTQYILKFLDFEWTSIKDEQFKTYVNTILKLI